MKVLRVLLIIVVVASVGLSVFAQPDVSKDKVIAYYFHGSFRCYSCRSIEKNTELALKKYFDEALKSGQLVFKTVNVEKKENKHFINDYQLYTKSVVLSLVRDGKEMKFKNLEKVWQLLRNEDEFYKYIKEKTQGFLDELSEEDKT